MSTGTADALSPREREVLAALAGHATNAEIAERLFLSVRTVESHVASLLRKTGARDRRALADLGGEPAASAPPVASTLTSFIGRAQERAALAAALGEHRLVTALGPGGVGKTRLAFSVAADLADQYPEGSWLVDLVPVMGPARIAPTIAERIGVQERQGRAPVDALEAWLSTRTTLLVLDNCEHLLDPVAELLERLLAACPGLTVLATSRTRLAVPFEWVFPVPGLSAGPDGDAAALFSARALAAGTRLTDADRERVEAICTGLEGVALAIELAAARLPSLGLDGLEAGLGDRLALLTGGRRADARHRSLRAAVDWSHELLAPEERAVLRRVSVFATPFPAGAAADVVTALPGVPRGAVPAALATLVDCSLLDALRTPDGTRYRALETIRQYGAELLEAEGETTAVRSAHLRWCILHADQLPVEPQDDERWIREVDALADEARTALARELPDADRQGAFRLAERIARLVFARGAPAEAQRRFEQAAALAADPATRGRVLVAAAGAAEARQFGAPSIRLRGEAARAFRRPARTPWPRWSSRARPRASSGSRASSRPGRSRRPPCPCSRRRAPSPGTTRGRSPASRSPGSSGWTTTTLRRSRRPSTCCPSSSGWTTASPAAACSTGSPRSAWPVATSPVPSPHPPLASSCSRPSASAPRWVPSSPTHCR